MGDPQGLGAAVQEDMTVRTSRFPKSRLTEITEPLRDNSYENTFYHEMWRGGLDRHLSEPDRGSYRVRRQNPARNLMEAQPMDLVNQSIPLSYLSVEVVSNDGSLHQVQLYTDIDGEWLAQGDQLVEWDVALGDTVTLEYSLQNQTQFGAVGGRLRYGNVIYSTKQVCHSPST